MNMTEEQKARVIANCEVIAKGLREGKQLQFRCEGDGIGWKNDQYDEFDASPHIEYRIKPEPRTIWVNHYLNGMWCSHESRGAAIADSDGAIEAAIEYREVMK